MRFFLLLVLVTMFSCKKLREKERTEVTPPISEIVKTIANPTGIDSQTPNLFSTNDTLWMSWLETKDSTDYLKFASYSNEKWNTPTTVTSGKDWFVNWADFPAIAVNNSNVLTNTLQMSDTGTYTYDVKLHLNQDLKSKKSNFILHNDGTKSEHGFVSLQPFGQDSFYAVWLDGRNTGGAMDHDDHSSSGGAMTLRGAVISSDGVISNEEEIDHRVCDCCQTDLTVTKDNQIIVAYRDRSEAEIRDISIKKWNETSGWSEPIAVGNDNWKIAGCPVNGPALASYNNEYAVAWYTEANKDPRVQLAFGDIDKNQLESPITINTNPTIGRIDVLMISQKEAVVSWIEDNGDDTLIQILKVNNDGTKGDVVTIASTSASRASGFPRMAILDGNVILAYTLIEKDTPSRIETKIIPIEVL